MRTKVGLWIDHRKAVIVTINDEDTKINVIKSNTEKHLRAADPSLKGPFKARQVPADDKHEREFVEHLNVYYNGIIDTICNAGDIFIFGPGEAKNELKKMLGKNNLAGRIAAIKVAGRMTDNQIMARVRKYFEPAIDAGIYEIESPHQRMKTNGGPAIRT